MESVECSRCHRRFEDATLLSLHHEFETCFKLNQFPSSPTSPSSKEPLICPICDKFFPDPLVLQFHIEDDHEQNSVDTTTSDQLYAQELDRRERMKQQYKQQNTASAISYDDNLKSEDAQMARLLQEEENAQSFEEFQNRYGGSTRTFNERARWNLDKIYRNNKISHSAYEEYKEKLDEMIAQPTERTESKSSGTEKRIIPILSSLSMGNLADRRLCSSSCDHMGSTWLDQGWSCGYKNFQMLLSSLRNDPLYSNHLFGANNRDIPSVSYLQNLIEKAWSAGFDSEGREQLNGRLVNSTKWIGPTEVMACLANLNIRTELYDFHQPKNLEKANAFQYLFEWIRNHFQQRSGDIIHPLYLQHEGHSRTVVGYEQFRKGYIRLLIFDPSTPKFKIEKFFANTEGEAHLFRRSLQSFQKPVYQVLVVRGLLNPEEREAAKRLRSIKVPVPNA